ncbi:hypothetical protein MMK25_33350, partial [Bacillus cereus]|nr:hypothetical protein [Bacillus cereus]
NNIIIKYITNNNYFFKTPNTITINNTTTKHKSITNKKTLKRGNREWLDCRKRKKRICFLGHR